MNKKVIRLTEADLHKIVKKSIRRIVSEASAAPNGYKHRFDPNRRNGDFPIEQPEWTKDPRWQGWTGEDPEWIMQRQKESGDPYYGDKRQARVSESQLHQIVKESVKKELSEGWFGNDKKYGEKWYNPLTWMSKAAKAKQDQFEKEYEEWKRKRASDEAMAKEIERRQQMGLSKWKKADELNDLENRRELYQRYGM